ncbi:hypothetical protein [Sinomonas humi]|uniref:Uncharacterized protein n=1 Tax=Sinomonas humi TaxID=1338436 RepID=A0A0B2AA40_9MICC|nr:hypothetical protein [Sinomonas humi]KHL00429.1 hypothetical protein LK10_19650 [Sinomonas humi]
MERLGLSRPELPVRKPRKEIPAPVVDETEEPEAEDVELPEGDYFSLTVGPAEILKGEDLAEVLRDARAALKVLTDERDALDRDLAELDAAAQDRTRQRAEIEAARDARADEADVAGVVDAETLLSALARVDARQEVKAEAKRARRAELAESLIPPAEGAVRDAEAAVAEHAAEHAGKVPHTLVDWLFRNTVEALLRQSGLDGNDAPGFAEHLSLLADSVARTAAADPGRAERAYEDALKPRPEPKLSLAEAQEQFRQAGVRLRELQIEQAAEREARVAYGNAQQFIAAGINAR